MDRITDYLIKAKIEAIGFDYTDEEECLKAIKLNTWNFCYIENPSKKLELERHSDMQVRVNFYTEEDLIRGVAVEKSNIRYGIISELSEEAKEMLIYIV